jgi:Na+/proline symporter
VSDDARRGRKLRIRSTRDWTPEDGIWEQAALAWQTEALPSVRASAERWAAGLSTLLGGAGIGVLLAGPGRFISLESCYETLAKSLFFAAGIAALVALALAIAAASATSRTLFLLSGPALRKVHRQAVRRAVTQLGISRIATMIALTLLLASAALLFFGPTDPSTPASATTSQAPRPAP